MVVESDRKKRLRDETLVCERCGVTFLWPVEEQRQAAAGKIDAPTYCAGCRLLLPSPGRERGVVKWYDARKRYGFIVRQNAADIFTHRSQLEETGRLHEGDLVEFVVEEGDKGLIAADVHLLQRESKDEG